MTTPMGEFYSPGLSPLVPQDRRNFASFASPAEGDPWPARSSVASAPTIIHTDDLEGRTAPWFARRSAVSLTFRFLSPSGAFRSFGSPVHPRTGDRRVPHPRPRGATSPPRRTARAGRSRRSYNSSRSPGPTQVGSHHHDEERSATGGARDPRRVAGSGTTVRHRGHRPTRVRPTHRVGGVGRVLWHEAMGTSRRRTGVPLPASP